MRTHLSRSPIFLSLFTLPLGLLWPLGHILLFWLRFHTVPGSSPWDTFVESLVFYPMGLLSFLFLFFFLQKARTSRIRRYTLSGYLFGMFPAYIGSLGGGLFFSPPYWTMLGTVLGGGIPLILFMFSFYLLATYTQKSGAEEARIAPSP